MVRALARGTSGTAARRLRTRPGVALLLALTIVVVLTAFLSELFFDTGMETRAVANFRDSDQAQALARSAFKAMEVALKTESEQTLQFGTTQLNALLQVSAAPFEEGLLTRMQVTSLDGLYNVNQLGQVRPGTSQDTLRWALFRNAIAAIPLPNDAEGQPLPALSERQVAALYSALVDWIDADDSEYVALGAPGAERRAYGNDNPEYDIKNGPLDRLEEMRLVRGFAPAHLPWAEIEKRFTALPAGVSTGGLIGEKLDVNLATRNEIARFLTERAVDDAKVLEDASLGPAWKNVNSLAAGADAIAAAIVPEGFQRPYFKDTTALQTALAAAGVSTQGSPVTATTLNLVFSTCSKYLRVQATVDVHGTVSTLDALMQVTRPQGCGPASSVQALRITLR
ncbi:MAG: general secretion pathway protein GspK [SAR324 cluster bacterium]